MTFEEFSEASHRAWELGERLEVGRRAADGLTALHERGDLAPLRELEAHIAQRRAWGWL